MSVVEPVIERSRNIRNDRYLSSETLDLLDVVAKSNLNRHGVPSTATSVERVRTGML